MQDRTNTVAETQAEVVEQVTVAVAAEQAAQESQAAKAAAEQAEQAAREAAAGTLKAVVKAYRRGESAYRIGLLEAGRLADLYLHQRLALGDKRAAAVQTLEGQLAAWSSAAVDVNRLIGVYHAFRLLAKEPGVKADAVPYGHFRDAWMQCVIRQSKDTAAEGWVLLPGLEDRCRETFATAVKDTLSRDAAVDACKGLLREYLALEAERAKAEQQRAEEAARAKAEQEATARAKREEAGRQLEAAEQAARDQDNANTSTALERSREELRRRQREEAEAQGRAEQAAREQARREQEADDASAREQKALDAQRKARDRAAKKAAKQGTDKGTETGTDKGTETGTDKGTETVKEPATVGGNLLRSAEQATPKDLAGMLLEQAKRNPDSLAVLWELGSVLVSLADAKDSLALALDSLLDGVQCALPQSKARQLLGMALAALRGRPGMSPAELLATNGHGHTANGTPAVARVA